MSKPQIEILGVYQLPVTEELFRKQFDILYGYEMTGAERVKAERSCRSQLSSAVLIEALVKDRDNYFGVGDFAQQYEDKPEDSWQVAWAEAFLTPDGKSLVVERGADPPKTGDLRVAFFMHYWDPDRPLHTSYGKFTCPQIQEMPERLKRLVPYITAD